MGDNLLEALIEGQHAPLHPKLVEVHANWSGWLVHGSVCTKARTEPKPIKARTRGDGGNGSHGLASVMLSHACGRFFRLRADSFPLSAARKAPHSHGDCSCCASFSRVGGVKTPREKQFLRLLESRALQGPRSREQRRNLHAPREAETGIRREGSHRSRHGSFAVRCRAAAPERTPKGCCAQATHFQRL